MKILFVKKLYSPVGGSEALTYQWARRLAARGHEVRVLSLWPIYRRHNFPPADRRLQLGTHFRAFDDSRVTVYQLAPYGGPVGKLLDVLPFFSLIRRKLALRLAGDCDIVHNVCREYTLAAWIIARSRGAPLVLTPLPHPGQPFSGAAKRDVTTYLEADGVVAMTAHEQRWYESLGLARDRIAVVGAGAVVHKGGSAERFRARHKVDGPVVLFVGRQENYKGHLATLHSARLVWQSHPRTHFVFIGEKSWSSTFYDPVARQRDPRVLDLGVVSEEEKADAYDACDVFCMPSNHETLGLTYLEAWRYGKPVIGGNIPPLREVISDGQDGLLVSQRAAEVANAISLILDDPSRGRSMGEAGRRKVETNYEWDTVIDRLERFYQQLAAGVDKK